MMAFKTRLFLTGFLFVAASADADPVRVTGGSASFSNQGPEMHFDLRAADFSAQGAVSEDDQTGSFVDFQVPMVLEEGMPASISSRWIIDAPGLVFWTGEFIFTGASASLVCSENACVTQPVRFTFTGTLTGLDALGHPGLTQELVGSGLGSAFFGANGPNAMTYDFDAAAATPEPASVLLLATGVAAMGRRALKRRCTG